MPDGRVVRVESDDPSIEIAFADGELRVVGAHKEPITLKPGKVDLRIVKKDARGNDFEFETDKLVVNKGDKIVLRIEVVEGQVQILQAGKGVLDSKPLPVKAGPIAVSDSDRAVAEWVLSVAVRELHGSSLICSIAFANFRARVSRFPPRIVVKQSPGIVNT